MARAKARTSASLWAGGIAGSPTITDLPPPCGSPAAAFLKVIARASRAHSASETSLAMRKPPMDGPVATLSTTRMALSPIAGSCTCTMRAGPRSSQKLKGSSMLIGGSGMDSGSLQVVDRRGEESRGLDTGDGAVVEGERQWQHAAHGRCALDGQHARLRASRAEDRHLRRHDDEFGEASAVHAEVAQRDCRTDEVRVRKRARRDPSLQVLDARAQRRRVVATGVAQHRHEQAVVALQRDAEVDLAVQRARLGAAVEPR